LLADTAEVHSFVVPKHPSGNLQLWQPELAQAATAKVALTSFFAQSSQCQFETFLFVCVVVFFPIAVSR
jgi:hypothetical protein